MNMRRQLLVVLAAVGLMAGTAGCWDELTPEGPVGDTAARGANAQVPAPETSDDGKSTYGSDECWHEANPPRGTEEGKLRPCVGSTRADSITTEE